MISSLKKFIDLRVKEVGIYSYYLLSFKWKNKVYSYWILEIKSEPDIKTVAININYKKLTVISLVKTRSDDNYGLGTK
jgi:hypothetical protein